MFNDNNDLSDREYFPNTFSFLRFLCFAFCPPVPESITRKLAFHPPPKGETYQLFIDDEDTPVKSISECVGKRIQMLIIGSPKLNCPLSLRHLTMFTLKTKAKNTIVCAKYSPISQHAQCSRSKQQVVIFAQPNSSDLGQFFHPLLSGFQAFMEDIGCDFYHFDYSGFGMSSGTPSERNCYFDMEAICEHVAKENPSKTIVLMGFSIGTAVAVHVASQVKPENLGGLILIAPFTSVLRLLTSKPERKEPIMFDRFVSCEKIKEIEVPVLICHGTNDEIVPHDQGLALHAQLKHDVHPQLVHGASHHDILQYTQVRNRIRSFLLNETHLQHPVEEDEENERRKDSEEISMTTFLQEMNATFQRSGSTGTDSAF